jgi:hypothetical protein
MRATGAESYHFSAQTLLSTDAVALAAGWTGHVGGTFDGDPRNEDWVEDSTNGLVTANYWDLQHGTYRAERHYRGAITGVLSDIAGAALKFVIGATTLATPGGAALVIFVGGLAAAVAKDGDLAAGAKIVGGTLWLAGPFGTMYAPPPRASPPSGTTAATSGPTNMRWPNGCSARPPRRGTSSGSPTRSVRTIGPSPSRDSMASSPSISVPRATPTR